MEDRKYPIFMDARFGLVYKEGANHMSGKISLEWVDIIYDMSKARHLYWSLSLIPFYLIRQPALCIIAPLSGGPLYNVWAAPFYV